MKKNVCILCSALIAMTVFSGGFASSAASASSKTTITIMQSKTEIQSDLQKVVNYYNNSQNKVTVNLLGTSGDSYATVLQTQFSATPGKAPTIYTISGFSATKFNPYMASLESSKAAKLLYSDFKGEVTVNGKISGLPMAVEGYGLIYNKSIFKKAGVTASKITSISSLVSACKKLQSVKGVEHPIAFSKENYFSFVHVFNWALAVSKNYKDQIKQLDSGKITFSGIPTVKTFANDLDKIKTYTNKALDSYDDQVSGFADGKFAMIHQGDWAQSVLDQNKVKFDYDIMPFPTSGNTKLAVGLSNAWRVNKYATADQQKAAIDFLDWLITSKKGQSYCADTFSFISAYKGVKSASTKLATDVSRYVKAGKTIPWVFNVDYPNGIDVDGASLMQKYYAGAISSSELLNELTTAWVKDAKN
jgi:ABC-type sugar transport system, periplasmic component